MNTKKIILSAIVVVLILTSLAGAVFLVRQTQETRRGAVDQLDEEESETTPTETPPADLDCNFNCTDLYAVDSEGNEIDDNQLQDLEPQEVCFEVEGWTDCEQGITGARFKIIGDDDWGWGDFQRDEDNTGGNGRFFYYNWCYDFSEITEPCYDIDAEVCVEGICQ